MIIEQTLRSFFAKHLGRQGSHTALQMSKWESSITSQVARLHQHWDTGIAASYGLEKIRRAADDGATSVLARMTKSLPSLKSIELVTIIMRVTQRHSNNNTEHNIPMRLQELR
jgi:hypothetical protein